MGNVRRALHRTDLSVSAEQVSPGGSITLRWNVIGVEAAVASVHLASSSADGPRMIESVPPHSSREIIFTQPGTFTFTLTATFGDGVKRVQQISISVQQACT